LVIAGLGGGIYGVMQFAGGDEVIDIQVVEVNEPAAVSAEQQLGKFGASLDYDINGQVSALSISGKTVTSKEMDMILQFKNLITLSLVQCEIDNSSLLNLKSLTKLATLDISGNPMVTDISASPLSRIETLRTLVAVGSGITPGGVEKLNDELPDLQVVTEEPDKAGPPKSPEAE